MPNMITPYLKTEGGKEGKLGNGKESLSGRKD
jgi:hypothetical protein